MYNFQNSYVYVYVNFNVFIYWHWAPVECSLTNSYLGMGSYGYSLDLIRYIHIEMNVDSQGLLPYRSLQHIYALVNFAVFMCLFDATSLHVSETTQICYSLDRRSWQISVILR